ncbi:hypothetical protein WICMUC_003017 [Wickerhamomyces mucosus]|uniref:Uncharacterized protein n=1 Tax=Wickerhamomyces mucosus TaxID=1378264 RepID=A0A9P8PNV9_9ASCO|nr:hypothetical protein WICMUC_003017 [Wickerhamomyces mucosus]
MYLIGFDSPVKIDLSNANSDSIETNLTSAGNLSPLLMNNKSPGTKFLPFSTILNPFLTTLTSIGNILLIDFITLFELKSCQKLKKAWNMKTINKTIPILNIGGNNKDGSISCCEIIPIDDSLNLLKTLGLLEVEPEFKSVSNLTLLDSKSELKFEFDESYSTFLE